MFHVPSPRGLPLPGTAVATRPARYPSRSPAARSSTLPAEGLRLLRLARCVVVAAAGGRR